MRTEVIQDGVSKPSTSGPSLKEERPFYFQVDYIHPQHTRLEEVNQMFQTMWNLGERFVLNEEELTIEERKKW